ncbi:MAG: hypothetical protein DBX47_00810 [Clostridiales bacterium]|nr:MAG: hypothetical protein DBX47_00810 [Clostridiales bacterium]
MKRKVLSLVLALMLFFAIPLATSAENVWDGGTADGFESGDGTEGNPYIIKTATQLAYLSKTVNEGNSYENKFLSLEADLTLSDIVEGNDLSPDENDKKWVPIGSYSKEASHPFSGSFNGNNHYITGIYCTGDTQIQGLFGYIVRAEGANIRIVDSLIYNSKYSGGIAGFATDCSILNALFSSSMVKGTLCGGIVGKAVRTNIYNCENGSKVNGGENSECNAGGIAGVSSAGEIRKSINLGNIVGFGYVGGIIGVNYGNVTDCVNEGTIYGGIYIGGICGQNTELISCSFNKGTVSAESDVVGGITGYSNKELYDCFNIGNITGVKFVGGISGYSNAAVNTCYNLGAISANSLFGAIVGGENPQAVNSYYLGDCGVGGVGVSLSESQMKDQNSFSGFDFNNKWTFDKTDLFSYPQLKSNPYTINIQGNVIINGNADYGNTITAIANIDPLLADVSYTWYRDGAPIEGANLKNYKVAKEDVGKKITVVVSGKGRFYGSIKSNEIIPSVAEVSGKISLFGRFQPGNKLSVVLTSVTPSEVECEYRWYRNGAVIKDQTQAEYMLTQADANTQISVELIGKGSCQGKLISANYTIYEQKLVMGDIDGNNKAQLNDAMQVFRTVAGRFELDGNMFHCADINKNNKIALDDAMKIFQYVAGKRAEL